MYILISIFDMGRKAQYNKEQFVSAALRLLAQKGPTGVTMKGVAEEAGAPMGSVYHRFPSRDVLMAELWVRTAASFQQGFLRALEQGDGLSAALYTPRWIRKHPQEGRVLLMYRREDLLKDAWPSGLKARARQLTDALDRGVRSFIRKKFHTRSRETLDRTLFALIDVPHAAVRRYLEVGQAPPEGIDALIQETYFAILEGKHESI